MGAGEEVREVVGVEVREAEGLLEGRGEVIVDIVGVGACESEVVCFLFQAAEGVDPGVCSRLMASS